jgi:hypothetical protein
MIMIKRTILSLIVLALLTPAETASSRNDHLEPPPEPIFLSAPKSLFMEQELSRIQVYYEKLLAILLDGFGASSRICYVVMPSFTPEYAWSAECGEDGGCFLLVHRMTKNFWYRKNPEMTRRRIAISKPLYDSLQELFAEATARIRPGQGFVVLDGTGYYFMYGDTGGNLRIGFTHSPAPGSLMDRLTVICEKSLSAPADASDSEREMQTEIGKILAEIRKQPAIPQSAAGFPEDEVRDDNL